MNEAGLNNQNQNQNQADGDDPAQEFYLFIPSELRKWLPAVLRPDPSWKFPLWPCEKAGYGHMASGHLWARVLRDWLLAHGWEEVGRPGKGCMYAKGTLLACVYVDDVKVCGGSPRHAPMKK